MRQSESRRAEGRSTTQAGKAATPVVAAWQPERAAGGASSEGGDQESLRPLTTRDRLARRFLLGPSGSPLASYGEPPQRERDGR